MLLVFGSANADLVFELAHLPRPGETVLCPGHAFAPGGKGANQAVAAARAGAAVRFAGRVGEDGHGSRMAGVLNAAGVDTGLLRPSPRPTGVAIIAVEVGTGENSIIVASGANLDVRASDVPDAALAGPGTTVLAQNEVPTPETLALLARAKAAGALTILNLAPAGGAGLADLAAADVLLANAGEAAALAGDGGGAGGPEPAARALAAGRRAAVVTLGAAGALVATGPGAAFRVPALAVDPVVDTTGAGDAFAGAFAAALDAGLGLEAAARRAAVAGALACTGLGAQAALPTGAAILAALPRLGPSVAL